MSAPADNAAGFASLQAMIDSLEGLERVAEEFAPVAAKELDAETRRTIAAGQSPDGKAWIPNKDGSRPLVTAGNALTTKALGTRIVQQVTGHIALHHLGRAKGAIRRQVLPSRAVPEPAIRAMQRAYAAFMSRRLA